MIKAKPYQQQPPNPAECPYCGEGFNNSLRLVHHRNAPYTECNRKHLEKRK